MEKTALSPEAEKFLWESQRNELTESLIYEGIAAREKNPRNQEILRNIAHQEREHEKIWRSYSGREVAPNRKKAFFYLLLSRILGFTFVLKKMEKGENAATRKYAQVMEQIPQAETISQEEEKHEQELLEMLPEGLSVH